MNNKHNIKKELEELSPFLANLKKEDSSFGVPDDYFQKMQGEVFRKVEASNVSQKEKAPSFFQKTITDSVQTIYALLYGRYLMPVVSFLFLIAVGGVYLLKPGATTPTIGKSELLLFADISVEEIDSYIEENIDDFEMDELVDLIDTETIAAIETDNINTFENANDEAFEAELDDYIDEIIDDFDIDELEDIL